MVIPATICSGARLLRCKVSRPEVHKASTLRAHLLLGKVPNAEEVLKLINRAMTTIWPNILSIVAGGHASMFTDLHLADDGVTVNSRYASSPSGNDR